MKKTQLKVDDVFSDITGEDNISQDEINKFSNFITEMM